MDAERLFARYQDLQRYVGWTPDDAGRAARLEPTIAPFIGEVIDDFYDEVQRHAETRQVLKGGDAQVQRLKGTLRAWLAQLFSGQYDAHYVAARWRVGMRHVEIGVDQQYTNVALARVRQRLLEVLHRRWTGSPVELAECLASLHKLLDLDLAIIQDAYQFEHVQQQKRVERLIAIGQMASGIAHELRNPLNVVRTSVFYLQHAKRPAPEKQAEHLDRIQRQVGVADGVITALSDFAKLPLPDFRPVDALSLIRDTAAHLALPDNVQLKIDCQGDEPSVLGDPRQLFVVLGNLLRNAADAMPDGGVITASVGTDGERVLIRVADTGGGIDAANLARVFEPFFSTKVRGIGLGLAIVRSIVENHQGTVTVASAPGTGSCFTLSLRMAGTREGNSHGTQGT